MTNSGEKEGLRGMLERKRDEKYQVNTFDNDTIPQYHERIGWDAAVELLLPHVELLEFYAQGGNFNTDVWEHKELGFFTGKRARAAISALREKLGEK